MELAPSWPNHLPREPPAWGQAFNTWAFFIYFWRILHVETMTKTRKIKEKKFKERLILSHIHTNFSCHFSYKLLQREKQYSPQLKNGEWQQWRCKHRKTHFGMELTVHHRLRPETASLYKCPQGSGYDHNQSVIGKEICNI